MLYLVREGPLEKYSITTTIEEDPRDMIDTPEKLASAINGTYVGRFNNQPAKGQLNIGDDLFNEKFTTIILNSDRPVEAFFIVFKKISNKTLKQLFLASAIVVDFLLGNQSAKSSLLPNEQEIVNDVQRRRNEEAREEQRAANAAALEEHFKPKVPTQLAESIKKYNETQERKETEPKAEPKAEPEAEQESEETKRKRHEEADKIINSKRDDKTDRDLSEGMKQFIREIITSDVEAKLNGFNTVVGPDGMDILNNVLKTTRVKSLKMEFKHYGSGAIEAISSLKSNENIEHLDLSGNGISRWNMRTNDMRESGPEGIVNIIYSNSNIKTLNLANTSVFEKAKSAESFAEALRLSVGLQQINLSNTGLGDKGAKELACAFTLTENEKQEQQRYAEKQTIYENKKNEDNNTTLVEKYKPKEPDVPSYLNRSLTHINLSNNNISDIGAKALCEALVSNVNSTYDSRAKEKTTVKELDLSGNKISDVTEVRKLLKANQNITINLSGNNISPEDMSELKKDFVDRVVNKPPAAEEAYTPKVKK
jgi:mannose/fructose/N-acetylgalactosamine-specific phosphotransferase system component IIB